MVDCICKDMQDFYEYVRKKLLNIVKKSCSDGYYDLNLQSLGSIIKNEFNEFFGEEEDIYELAGVK